MCGRVHAATQDNTPNLKIHLEQGPTPALPHICSPSDAPLALLVRRSTSTNIIDNEIFY
jgi:hypothetical protein